MLNNINHLVGSTVTATDGEMGHVKEAYFDDQAWTIRYLVVNTGSWLLGKEVLIAPVAIKQPLGDVKNLDVWLNQEQVKNSPDIDTHQSVSRQHEQEFARYYAYANYWDGGGLLPMSPMPDPDPGLVAADKPVQDTHLRSSAKVSGYELHALDGSIGHVENFVFDDESWVIRYLVVNPRTWWPLGQQVLIATHWVDSIDWDSRSIAVRLTREQIKSSPLYEEAAPIGRDYEKRLHAAYDRQGYWD